MLGGSPRREKHASPQVSLVRKVIVKLDGTHAEPAPMVTLSLRQRQDLGIEAAQSAMFQQDKIWSRYSSDKVDIAHTLARVIRTLSKSLPLTRPMTALSIGSSNEPQFRILASAFSGGLYLLDIEQAALDVVRERVGRQHTPHVRTIHGDYRAMLGDRGSTVRFRAEQLGGRRMTLITLHHSLYYSPQASWQGLVGNLYRTILARPRHVGASLRDASVSLGETRPRAGPSAAIHAVLMASRSRTPTTTTWLYNHFAGKFFGHHNDQDLAAFARALRRDQALADAQVLTRTHLVEFFVDDFGQFMAVVWMILLHPNVHRFTPDQQCEVIEHVYQHHWRPRQPLVQLQNHLVIYRNGQGTAGLI
jgi:hypothetical protein